MIQGEILSSFFNKEASNHIWFGVKIVPLKFNRNEVKELVSKDTLQNINKTIRELKEKNPEIIEQVVVFKKIDLKKPEESVKIYASINFENDVLGYFILSMARGFQYIEDGSVFIGKPFNGLFLRNGINIVSAGRTTLLLVVTNKQQSIRSMSGNVDKSIEQAAGLIAKIMG